MFANKQTRDKREADSAAEWAKAKASWRTSRRVLYAILAIIAAVFIYFSGERSGYIAGRNAKPEHVSTP